jgi:hypothetical protein
VNGHEKVENWSKFFMEEMRSFSVNLLFILGPPPGLVPLGQGHRGALHPANVDRVGGQTGNKKIVFFRFFTFLQSFLTFFLHFWTFWRDFINFVDFFPNLII